MKEKLKKIGLVEHNQYTYYVQSLDLFTRTQLASCLGITLEEQQKQGGIYRVNDVTAKGKTKT